jgi:NAD(P)-dependent dehydrogenase (short-subunit alcohol dehydrogenase family)
MTDVKGKLAIVTGGTSGIGLGIARALSAAGARVVATYRTGRNLAPAVEQFERDGARVSTFQLDVTDREAMTDFADTIEAKFGKVHILCNNAGIGIGTRVADASYQDWDWALNVNLGGVINGVREFLPRILAHGEDGHIVSTASMGGIFLNASAGVYNTTKYALVGMMEALRADLLGTNVGVSVYCPGLVDTNIYLTEESRPEEFGGPSSRWSPEKLADIKARIMSAGMAPLEAGESVVRGIAASDLYIFSHPEFYQGVEERFDAILTALKGDTSRVPQERLGAEAITLRHPLYAMELKRMADSAKTPEPSLT